MTPQDQLDARKVVVAGMKVMFSEKMFPVFKAGLMKDMPVPKKLAVEALGLLKLLQDDKANGSIPRRILLPAAAMLMLKMAEFMEDTGIAKPTPQDLAEAKKTLYEMIEKVFPKVAPRGDMTQPAAAGPPPEQPVATTPPPPAGGAGLIQSLPQGGA